jgi:hypothetical protein
LECHEASKHHLLEFGFFLLDLANLGFLLRENLLLCSSYLPLGVSNWTVIYINTVPHQVLALHKSNVQEIIYR